jgi:hypothetical protein
MGNSAIRGAGERMSFAKTPAETKNETVFGGEGLNPILASIQREDFKGQEPVWACSTHMY